MKIVDPTTALIWASEQANLKRHELAELSGVNVTTVSLSLNRRSVPGTLNFLAMLNACGFDVVLVPKAKGGQSDEVVC